MAGADRNGDNEEKRLGPAAAWAWVLQVAGAVTGLGVMVYVVGAVTIWVRVWKAGYPADVALEHQPRSAVIALGFRGVLLVSLTAAGVAAAAFVPRAFYLRWRNRRPRDEAWQVEDLWRNALFRRIAVLDVLELSLLLLAATAALSFVGWRTFGVALLLAAAVVVARWYPERPAPFPTLVALVVLAATAVVAAVCWQVGGTVRIQGVRISPLPKEIVTRSPSPEALSHVPFPFFGATDDFVYVADVRSAIPISGGPDPAYRFNFCGEPPTIVELKRDGLLLTYVAGKDVLYRDVPPPGLALWHHLFGPARRKHAKRNTLTPEQQKLEREKTAICERLEQIRAKTGP